jgi:PAS domain S-box-containing protein
MSKDMIRSPAPKGTGPSRPATAQTPENRAEEQAELAEVRAQLGEAQQTIEAIRGGGIDSLMIGPPGQEQVYALVSADRPYRLIVEAMNEGAVTVSPRGVILNANPRFAAMTGRSATDLVGTTVLDLIHAARRPAFAALLDVGAGHSARGEVDLIGPGGGTVPVLLAVSGFDLDGMLLRCLVLTDLTAQRASQTQAAEAHEALRESEERLRALFDNAPVGIEEIALSGELIRGNPRFCEITGYTTDELRSLRVQDITHPDDLAADLAGLQRLRSGESDAYSMEKQDLRKDGGVIRVEANRAVVRGRDGEPLLFVGALRDITAQREAEAAVRTLTADLEARVQQRTAELERSNTNLQAFTYSISHDLRAPLRALNGFSEALLEEYGDDLGETGRGYAGRIQAASRRMSSLIDDLLQLSRVSRVNLNLGRVDLSAEVADILGELRAREPGRRVRCTIQDGVWGTADSGLVRTVLQNLIENAWKFTARCDAATIEFATTTTDDAEVCCYVRDNGAGFDPAYASKLFQPFQRLHTAGEFPGTGVGLTSVQRIIERHGGRVWAEGAVGRGATFYFTLGAKESLAAP